ncbi:MAG: caspase family protein [Cocleimonas sp.]|nr:caspase family protein [Cocleimonas sp.]
MTKGISLHIGLNHIDPAYYGDESRLSGCENDANDYVKIATSTGFKVTKLLNEEATCQRVLQFIKQAAATLTDDDIFFISYSGHGSYLPDTSGDEADRQDETWCLYDRMLIDDELKSAWTGFKSGVRILIISDSCHSGTVDRPLLEDQSQGNPPASRSLPIKALQQALKKDNTFYTSLKTKGGGTRISASIVLLAGCQDNEESLDIGINGAFTATLKRVWGRGNFNGNYEQFLTQIKSSLGSTVNAQGYSYDDSQHPNLELSGNVSASFSKKRPFSI